MEKSLNELKKNFMTEYANMTPAKDVLDFLEFYKNYNNQLREQVKDLHEMLNGIVKVLQNLHQNKQDQSSMTPLNVSINIDKNIATENVSEKSHDITTIDFPVNKSFSTPNCLHFEAPLNFSNGLNETKLNDLNKLSCSSNIPEECGNMQSKIPKNKKLANQQENIRNIKHHLYLQNRIEVQSNTSKDNSTECVKNCKNSNKISTNKHLTKSANHKTKTEATEIKELNFTPAKNITEETTFIIRLIKNI